MLWEDALTGYWLERQRNLSSATVANYQHTHRRFRVWMGESDAHIEAITSDHVRQWLASLHASGLAPKSVANDWIALSAPVDLGRNRAEDPAHHPRQGPAPALQTSAHRRLPRAPKLEPCSTLPATIARGPAAAGKSCRNVAAPATVIGRSC